MKSDFVTFFGDYEQNRLTTYKAGSSAVVFAFANGDISKAKSDVNEPLQRYGGVGVTVDLAKATAQVSVHRNTSYQQPSRLLRLGVDRTEWSDIPKTLQLERGDHLLIPVDQKSQTALEDLCRNLKYLPADYEDIIMNAIRRPSLEWRMARLERIADFDQPLKNDPSSSSKNLKGAVQRNQDASFSMKALWLAMFLVLGALCATGGAYWRSFQNSPAISNQNANSNENGSSSSSNGAQGTVTTNTGNTGAGTSKAAQTQTTLTLSETQPSKKKLRFKVQVINSDGNTPPVGTVGLLDGTNKQVGALRALDKNGDAVIDIAKPRVGDYQFIAVFSPSRDAKFQPSQSTPPYSIAVSAKGQTNVAGGSGGGSTGRTPSTRGAGGAGASGAGGAGGAGASGVGGAGGAGASGAGGAGGAG
ncbi:MAG TPA: hypothetical protein VG759_27120, partial [Candidatus Angelobacter sp.]|nr:hypothetical protein [Candidatus Angelobacter sp.]